MTTARQLYQLQEFDWDIDRSRASLASIEERLRDDSALVKARKEAEKRAEKALQLRKEHGAHELEVEDFRQKIKTLEARLFSGVVKNPRELKGQEQELHYIKQHALQAEEKLLALMIDLEEAEGPAAKSQEELARMEAEWEKTRATLIQEKAVLTEQFNTLSRRRGELDAVTNPSQLAQYERLRQSRHGHAVAKVERGMCQGCRLTLPTQELQRVRAAKEPVQCSSCGRILYVN